MIDDRQATPSSQLDDLVIFDREASEFGWRCYLGDLYGKPEVPAYAAPARAAAAATSIRIAPSCRPDRARD